MKNATYWMEYLERLAEGQEKGTIKPNQAVEMNNTAGKVISLAKASMDAYRAMEKTKGMAVIPALQYDQTETTQAIPLKAEAKQ